MFPQPVCKLILTMATTFMKQKLKYPKKIVLEG